MYNVSPILSSIPTSFISKVVYSYDPPRIDSLSEIYSSCLKQPDGTLFLIDVDETVICSRFMLGSKNWREYITKATNKNCHDIFSYALAKKDSIKSMEEMTCDFVKALQKKYVVCGFTTRERKFWYDMPQKGVDQLTVNQLISVGVDFDHGSLEKTYFDLSQDPHYFKGIFFANTQLKGEYLTNLLKKTCLKIPKIIFIDDKKPQVSSVISALADLEIPNECYLYSAEEKKSFDPLIANIQLYHFYQCKGQKIISDEEAALIVENDRKNNLAKDADFYLAQISSIADPYEWIQSFDAT